VHQVTSKLIDRSAVTYKKPEDGHSIIFSSISGFSLFHDVFNFTSANVFLFSSLVTVKLQVGHVIDLACSSLQAEREKQKKGCSGL